MPKNMPREYKTEEQLKQEAKARMEQEAKTPQKPKPETLKKGANFWYHYKWHTIGITLAVILAVFFVKDTLFRTKPDLTVIMITNGYFEPDDIERLTHAIELAAEDDSGGGKIMVNVDFIVMPTGENPNDYAGQMRMIAVVAAAADPVYLLDRDAFDMLAAANEGVPIFEEFSAPAGALGIDGFEGLAFYLRKRGAFAKNPDYYQYCENFIVSLNER
jgi:hypothetical protein